jgi:hypothetical protein
VEYFEDLRNINHCEFVIMKLNPDSGKYILETELRTWSEYKRLKLAEEARRNPSRRNTLSAFLSKPEESPDGSAPSSSTAGSNQPAANENDGHVLDSHKPATTDGTTDHSIHRKVASIPPHLLSRGTTSGSETPHEQPSDDEIESYPFPPPQMPDANRSMASAVRRIPQRQATPEDIERWTQESGMGSGKPADALGDEPEADGDVLSSEEPGLGSLVEAEREDKSLRGSVY